LEAIALQGGGFVLSDAPDRSRAITRWQDVATCYQHFPNSMIPKNFLPAPCLWRISVAFGWPKYLDWAGISAVCGSVLDASSLPITLQSGKYQNIRG